MSLGRKQRIENADWLEAVEKIEDLVSKKDLDKLVKATAKEIKEQVKGHKVAYAWSGGKDSLVLSSICENAGIHDSVFVHCNLEYPEFLNWCLENKPQGCEVINTGQDLNWLKEHPKMLFPTTSDLIGRWFGIVQHSGIRKYYKDHDLDMVILGRRRADGNYVGKGSNIYTNGNGITQYSPLADWSHEMILAYIHYNNIQLPPIYGWKDGYFCGTHPWPSRMGTNSISDGYRDVYEIDPQIVIDAAGTLDSAAAFLKEVDG